MKHTKHRYHLVLDRCGYREKIVNNTNYILIFSSEFI